MADDKTIQNDYSLTWKSLEDGRYQCLVCPHNCKLREGQRGICQARIGQSGVKLDAFGKITTAAVEPIEKKPIYHYKPNLKTLSIGGFGCSMFCDFCENWQVSQVNKSDSSEYLSPIDVINLAIKESCGAICFTYNEPIIYFEYLLELFDCAKSKI
jgi:pyruvate formate lyase activating enzyme